MGLRGVERLCEDIVAPNRNVDHVFRMSVVECEDGRVFTGLAPRASLAANDKLQIACIGVANRATENVNGVAGQAIVALCDIDDTFLDRYTKPQPRFPGARVYNDYPELIEPEADKVDAVVVSTADHHPVPASIRAATSSSRPRAS